jgi:4-oxalocrotonate tautomerase
MLSASGIRFFYSSELKCLLNSKLQGVFMPVIQVHMLEGRTEEQKKELVKAINQAMIEIAKAKPEDTNVIIHEIPRTHWGIGGLLLAEKK